MSNYFLSKFVNKLMTLFFCNVSRQSSTERVMHTQAAATGYIHGI